jgi:hypothetical protein
MTATVAAQVSSPKFEKLQIVAQTLRQRSEKLPTDKAMPFLDLLRRVERLQGGGR